MSVGFGPNLAKRETKTCQTCQTITDNEAANSAAARHHVATGPAADAARWHGDEQVTRAEVNYNKAANSAAARHHTTQQLEDHWPPRRPGGPGSVQVKLTRMTRMVTVAAATMAGGGKGGLPPPTQC